MSDDTVLMSHGSGGTMMKRIIEEVFFEAYAGATLKRADAMLNNSRVRMAKFAPKTRWKSPRPLASPC